MTTHFEITAEERKIKLGSSAQLKDAALCDDLDGNARLTNVVEACDCPKCLDILKENPPYLAAGRSSDWSLTATVAAHDEDPDKSPVYWIWTDGEIHQITTTPRPPRISAGYGNLDALLALKGISKQRVIPREEASAAPRM